MAVTFRKTGQTLVEQELEKTFKELNSHLVRGSSPDGEVRFTSKTGATSYSAKPGDLVLVDPSAAPATVVLPDHRTCQGAWITISSDSSSTNPITVKSLVGGDPSTQYIDGVNQLVMHTAGATLWFRASSDGWRSF